MAKKDRKTVTLVSPDGDETIVSDPTAVNNLIFAGGYKPKGKTTPAEAAATVAPGPAPATVDGPTTASAKK